ncbi:MAG: ATP-binding protein [Prochlorococcaceae cyanobacterium]
MCAKVAHLRAHQISEVAGLERDRYLKVAELWTAPRPVALIITHGVSGSGKSWLSAQLAEALGAIRLRSDVERKRLFGLWGDPAPIRLSGDPYRREVSAQLFEQHLPALSRAVVAGGFTALIDATFLRLADRQPMQALAAELGVPLLIVACPCSPELARHRICQRQSLGHDPSDAGLEVLERQLAVIEPLSAAEQGSSLVFEPQASVSGLAAALRSRIAGGDKG